MSRPPGLKTFGYTGVQRYFLTFCSHQRRAWFTRPEAVELVTEQLVYTSTEQGVSVLAYCFMPDHFHALVTGEDDAAELRQFVKLVKQRSAYRFRQVAGARLWQEGYYDRVLRDEEDTPSVIAYIVDNPVRAGLVACPADYPHWGSLTHTREEILEFIGSRPGLRGPAYGRSSRPGLRGPAYGRSSRRA